MTGIWVRYVAGAVILALIVIGAVHAIRTPHWQDPFEVAE